VENKVRARRRLLKVVRIGPKIMGLGKRARGAADKCPAKTAGSTKMTGKVPLLAIIGATASGKSALALEVAYKTGAEILSVDSMQIYRGMDVGTAKPTAEQKKLVRHHLIDVAEPDEVFSAAKFVEQADEVIAGAKSRLVATGGTPMYFRTLFAGLFQGPSADEKLREKLRGIPGEELHAQLLRVDPDAARRIHPRDSKRLIRALEVHELTGKPISAMQGQWDENSPPRHPAVWIGLRWDRDALNMRINARVKEMVSSGWVEEVRELLRKYPALSKTAAEATGYAQVIGYLAGRVTLDDAIEQIKIATRQLARRQMKWFRRFPNVRWLEGAEQLEENVEKAIELWDGAL
jgi:tRNA dimethylallyltransferase